ncbi:ASPIC/UnbV domain-containing protein, partial [Pseudomonadota bacterium]
NSLLLNDNGKGFLDSEFVLGVEPRQDRIVAPWFELQCSGIDAGRQMCRDEEGRKVVWGVLGSRSSIIFDVDQDGDEDIVTLEFNAPPMVLVSNLSEKKDLNYLKVGLQGVQSNRDGIGATIKVYSGDQVYTKVKHGKSGYLSQSLHPVYFGLGASAKVDKVEISWPSGITQVIAGPIDSNQLLEIKEQ